MRASIPTVRIFLKRLGRKLWQLEGDTPKRVELAVLDYYKSKGWCGYFTEHEDYYWTIAFVAGWGDWSKKRPRKAENIHLLLKNVGDAKTLDEITRIDSATLLSRLREARRYFKDYFLFDSVKDLPDSEMNNFFERLLSFFEVVGAEGIRKDIDV